MASPVFTEPQAVGSGEMYHMKFNEPQGVESKMYTKTAALDEQLAVDLLKYFDTLVSAGMHEMKDSNPPEQGYSCGSSESDDSLLSRGPIYGAHARDDIFHQEIKLGFGTLGNTNSQVPYAMQWPDRMNPPAFEHPCPGGDLKDVRHSVDQGLYNTHAAKGAVHAKYKVGHPAAFAAEALDAHVHGVCPPKDLVFRPEFGQHAGGGCARFVPNPSPGAFNQQGARSAAPVARTNHQINNTVFAGRAPVPPPTMLQQKHAPVGRDVQKQALLVCMESMTDQCAMEEIAKDFRHEKYFYFRTAVKLTRWLFEQHRGAIQPWSVLVVGWREAKPCMTALEAAFTGDMSKVRPDARRAVLKKATGGRNAERRPVKIAVATMVVLLEAPSQREKAQTWMATAEGQIPSMKIVIAGSLAELPETLAALNNGQHCVGQQHHQPVCFPFGSLQPEPFADQEKQYIRLSV